ncbi:XVIPCD domain-containing protein [Lysobacter sp. CA199]|uniref:XVIPCD domain-containing protein n=1 Tax=Lysobacter sp. CA199 TaxID=3455608 RepID=UPI003F8D71CD
MRTCPAMPSTSPRNSARRRLPSTTTGAPVSTASDPNHSDRALLEKIREGVRGLDPQIGKPWDERSERLSASALSMAVAVEMKFNANDDVRLALNNASPTRAAGELLFAYRVGSTASPDPAANVAHMPVAEALTLPAQERYRQVQATRDAQAETQHQSPPQHENPTQAGLVAAR